MPPLFEIAIDRTTDPNDSLRTWELESGTQISKALKGDKERARRHYEVVCALAYQWVNLEKWHQKTREKSQYHVKNVLYTVGTYTVLYLLYHYSYF